MGTSEEMKNSIASEELSDNNRTEGEIEDESAETAAGGFPIYQLPAPPQPGLP